MSSIMERFFMHIVAYRAT